MLRLIPLAIAVVTLAGASAQAQTFQECKSNNQAVGAVAGALIGGAAGGVIANNTRRFDRGFRRGRFHRGRGFGRSRRGNPGLGIALGALAGGVVGSQLAKSADNCDRIVAKVHSDPFAHKHGGIDHNAARYGDPFGGRSMPYNGGSFPSDSFPAYPFEADPLAGGPYPEAGRDVEAYLGGQRECRVTRRTTRLPDGQDVEEQIQVCRAGPDGAWVITENGF